MLIHRPTVRVLDRFKVTVVVGQGSVLTFGRFKVSFYDLCLCFALMLGFVVVTWFVLRLYL